MIDLSNIKILSRLIDGRKTGVTLEPILLLIEHWESMVELCRKKLRFGQMKE